MKVKARICANQGGGGFERTRISGESLGCVVGSRDFNRVTYSKADARQVLLINKNYGFWMNLKLMLGG